MKKQAICLYLAWLLSCLAFLGSLYYSEIKHYYPCTLCWYQRICLYPLTLMLSIAFFKQDFKIFPYAIGFCFLGVFFSVYHIAIQMIPNFAPLHLCSSLISCSAVLDSGIKYITIPMLSLGCFLCMGVLLFLTRIRN